MPSHASTTTGTLRARPQSAVIERWSRLSRWALRSRRSRWWTCYALIATLCLCWTIATPLFASPDEPAHVVRAVSIVRGVLIGRDAPRNIVRGATQVRLPEIYRSAGSVGCFAFYPHIGAACAHFDGSSHLTTVYTSAGREPPAYFGLVGIPSRLFSASARGVYAMRVFSALLAAALLSSAVSSLERARRPGVAGLGLLVAMSPTALFFAGVVNPSSLEISGAIAVWATGIVLVRESPDRIDRRLVVRLAIAACVVALARALGPLWLVITGLILILLAGRQGAMRLWRSRSCQLGAAAIVVCAAFQTIWVLARGTLNTPPSGPQAASQLIRYSIGQTYWRFEQMIGVFGWLDTIAPSATIVIWTVVLGTIVFVAFVAARRGLVLAMAAVLGLSIAVPIVLEVQARHGGDFNWQGRYTLPLAVGLPILAGYALATVTVDDRLASQLRPYVRRLLWVFAAMVAVAQFLAFGQALRRYTVGSNGPVFFFLHPRWKPPVPALLVLLAYTIVYGALVAWLLFGRSAIPSRSGTDVAAEA